MDIQLCIKINYGKRRYYPKNKLAAFILRELMGRKSFTYEQVEKIRNVGIFNVSVTEPVDDIYQS